MDLIVGRGERPLSDEYLNKNPHTQRPLGPSGHETPTKLKVDDLGESPNDLTDTNSHNDHIEVQGNAGVRESFRDPVQGFLYHERAWMDGEVEYRGQPARRLISIFRFEDEQGEQFYKQEKERDPFVRKRPIVNEMENFFADLEDLGMLGYESHHVQFLEVLNRVPEDAVFFPGQFPMKRLPCFLIEMSLDL